MTVIIATVPSATTAGSAAPSGPAAGGLAGTYPNPTIGADVVGSANVVDAAAAAGLRKADIAVVSTTVTFDPPSIPTQTCAGASAPVAGAHSGDIIVVHPANNIWPSLLYAPGPWPAGRVHPHLQPVAERGRWVASGVSSVADSVAD